MDLISITIGIIALVGAFIGLIPLLGWLNWLVLPVAILGLVLGLLAKGDRGRNINIVVLVVAVIRLMLGGGIF